MKRATAKFLGTGKGLEMLGNESSSTTNPEPEVSASLLTPTERVLYSRNGPELHLQ